jgi:2-amino-4-hydroxy-6-hydroxymethyldihydropteridine diphosphokinase
VTLAYVGIGSNLGKPLEHVEQAFKDLGRIPQTALVKRSSLYRSKPLGYAEQPQFVNAVALLDTALAAAPLLDALQGIEARHGRRRSFPDAPRTLDLDLLLYGDAVMHEPGLVVPHPRMHLRAFVLKPLLEITPGLAIPAIGAAQAMLEQCADQSVERVRG